MIWPVARGRRYGHPTSGGAHAADTASVPRHAPFRSAGAGAELAPVVAARRGLPVTAHRRVPAVLARLNYSADGWAYPPRGGGGGPGAPRDSTGPAISPVAWAVRPAGFTE